jgi:hypothetical protein
MAAGGFRLIDFSSLLSFPLAAFPQAEDQSVTYVFFVERTIWLEAGLFGQSRKVTKMSALDHLETVHSHLNQ